MAIPVHHYVVQKMNPNHDGATGRFASGGGGAGGAKSSKMDSALNAASKAGASESAISSIKDAHASRDTNTLENLEAGFFEGFAGRHGIQTVDSNKYKALHTATVMALRDVTGTGKKDWPTIDEMK